MTKHPLPILKSVAAAYAFYRTHWQRVLIVGLPYIATSIAMILHLSANAGSATGSAALLGFVLMVLTTVTSVVFAAAVFRMAVNGDYSGWYGMKLGADEARVFVVNLLIGLLTFLVAMLGGIFAIAFVSAMAAGVMERAGLSEEAVTADINLVFAAFGPGEWGGVALVVLGFVVLVAWLAARLSPALPATLDRGRIQVLSVWPLSNGQAWRIVIASFITAVPVFLAGVGLYELISAGLGVRPLELAHTVDPSVENAGMIVKINEITRINGFIALVSVPLFAGLYAFIYAGLKQLADQNAEG